MKMQRTGLFTTHSLNAGNLFIYSKLNEFHHAWKDGLNEVVLRYVISGTENYRVDKETVSVSEGTLLLVNSGHAHEANIAYRTRPVSGFCLSLDDQLINDVYRNYAATETFLLDNPHVENNNSFEFFEGIYQRDDVLNQYFFSLAKNIDDLDGSVPVQTEELFYNFAFRLLQSQGAIKRKINNIEANKYSTRKELYSRINKAKRIMDMENAANLSVPELARSVAMSEFHFYRVFKQVYQVSPHQYQLRKRLEYSKEKLLGTVLSITEIAHQEGFADVQCFSKAFKKVFAISPTNFKNKLSRSN